MRMRAWVVRKPQRRMASGGLGRAAVAERARGGELVERSERRVDERLRDLHSGGAPRLVPRQYLQIELVDVLAPVSARPNDSRAAQVVKDADRRSLRDPSGQRNLPHRRAGIAGDLDQDVRVVGEESPGSQIFSPKGLDKRNSCIIIHVTVVII